MPRKTKNTIESRASGSIDALVGALIRAARNCADITQARMGEELGVTFQQIQKYEKGTNRVGPRALCVIAKLTKRPIEWFYGDAAEPDGAVHLRDIGTDLLQTVWGRRLAQAWLAMEEVQDREALLLIAERFAARAAP